MEDFKKYIGNQLYMVSFLLRQPTVFRFLWSAFPSEQLLSFLKFFFSSPVDTSIQCV